MKWYLILAIMLIALGCDDGMSGRSVDELCGYLDEPCCKGDLYQDEWGQIRMDQWCEGDLSCRAGICVTPPEFQAYDRNTGWD